MLSVSPRLFKSIGFFESNCTSHTKIGLFALGFLLGTVAIGSHFTMMSTPGVIAFSLTGALLTIPLLVCRQKTFERKFDIIHESPLEIAVLIFSMLDLQSLGRMALVSKSWRDRSDDASLWRPMLLAAFSTQPIGELEFSRAFFLKHTFKTNPARALFDNLSPVRLGYSILSSKPIFLCPDRNVAITSNLKDNISIWDLTYNTNGLLFSWDVPHEVAFVIDGKIIIAINDDGYVHIIDIDSQNVEKEAIFKDIKDFTSYKVCRCGNFLLYSSVDAQIISFWDCIRRGPLQLIPFDPIQHIVNSKACENSNVCFFAHQGSVIAWDLETQKQVCSLEKNSIKSAAYVGYLDQKYFAVTFVTGEILALDLVDKNKYSFDTQQMFALGSIELKEDYLLIRNGKRFFLINMKTGILTSYDYEVIYWVQSNLIIAVKDGQLHLIDPWSNQIYTRKWPACISQKERAKNVLLKDNNLHFTYHEHYHRFGFNPLENG